MSSVKRFEDLEIWQLARDLCKEIYLLTLTNNFTKDYELKDQIRKSSGSVMDNIAEGFERDGNVEFKQFLSISKGSCGEVRSQLYRAYDRNYVLEKELDKYLNETITLSKKNGNLMAYLIKSKYRGIKYKE